MNRGLRPRSRDMNDSFEKIWCLEHRRYELLKKMFNSFAVYLLCPSLNPNFALNVNSWTPINYYSHVNDAINATYFGFLWLVRRHEWFAGSYSQKVFLHFSACKKCIREHYFIVKNVVSYLYNDSDALLCINV